MSNRIKKFFLNYRFIFIFAILAIILGFSIIFIYLPLAKDLRDLNSRYTRKFLELDKIKDKIAVADKIKAKIIVYSQDLPSALDELTKKANALGINFDFIKQEKLINLSQGYQVLPILIESVCDFQALGSFLGSLEDLEKSVIVLNQLEINREEDSLPNLRVDLQLGIYLRSD